MRSPTTIGPTLALLTLATMTAASGCGDLMEGSLINAAYKPNGDVVAFAPGEARVLDADARRTLKTFTLPASVEGYSQDHRHVLSADGTTAAIGIGKSVDVFNVQTGANLAHIAVYDAPEERYPIAGVALSRDGSLVAVTIAPIYFGRPRLAVWRVADQTLLADFQQPADRKFWGWSWTVSFSPDGDIIYATFCSPGTDETVIGEYLTAWSVKDGSLLWEQPGGLYSPDGRTSQFGVDVILSPDGTTLAAATTKVRRFKAADGTELADTTSDILPSSPWGRGFSPDGQNVVLATEGALEIVGPDGALIRSWPSGETGACQSAQFSPDGSRIVTACGSQLKIWNATTGALLHSRKITTQVY